MRRLLIDAAMLVLIELSRLDLRFPSHSIARSPGLHIRLALVGLRLGDLLALSARREAEEEDGKKDFHD
jgi:hypothetical protein